MTINIRLLGSPAISLSSQLSPIFKTAKAEGLFYYLAATRVSHSRATLATLFWGDMLESKARVNLSKALADVREQVGEYMTIATQTVTFNAALPYQLDLENFLASPPPAGDTLAGVQAQADLYCGDFLAGFYVRNAPEFEQWQLAERERLRTAATQRFATLATRYQRSGDEVNAISTLRRLLVLEPWREEIHRQLMALLVHSGEPHAAMRQYELCRLALADELDVAPGQAITQLYTELRANGKAAGTRESPATLPVLLAATEFVQDQAKPSSHLPNPATAFVGREAEIEGLVTRLQGPTCRLLTLIGPGGIGKTRLSLEVAKAFVGSTVPTVFSDGLFFVNLMPVDTAAGMIAAIAEALGFTFYANTPPQQQLFSYLKPRQLLLILDNFEHLQQESALIAELLAVAPGLKVLVTSREALPLQAAYFHSVQGLAYPDGQPATIVNATATDAVRLFAQCAHRHQATFSLPQQLDSVGTICRIVGGLPLALELAAAWLKSLSCAQIAQELTKGLELLQANFVDIPERHRNMRIVFTQTWQRLTVQETAVMQRLAIFRGGFTLGAAEQVAQASIHTLATLAEKALIRLDEAGRYRVHELLRQFAYEKLAADQASAQVAAAAHADFFLNLATQLKASLADQRQQVALATLQADIDNLRIAWLWAMQQPTLPNIAQALDSIYAFFLFTCRYSEGKELFSTSHALLDDTTVNQPALLTSTIANQVATRTAVFAYHLGEYEQPSQHFRALLSTARPDAVDNDIAIAHMILGQIAGWQGKGAEAEEHLQESVALYQTLGDRSSMASVLHGMAEMYAHAADYHKAVDSAQACLSIGIQLGRDDLIGNAQCTLGFAHKSLGRPKVALQHYQQGCVYNEKAGNRLGYALSVGGVGIELCQLDMKQWPEGFALIRQSLAICREIGHFIHIVTRLYSLADACIHGQRYMEAISFAQECVQSATEAHFDRAICFGLLTMGESYCALDDFATGRLCLQQAANKAVKSNYHGVTHIVIAYALLLEKEAGQLLSAPFIQNRIQAVLLTTAALRDPSWYVYHQQAQHLLERQQAILPADQFTSAQALAHQHTLEELVTQILAL